MVRCVEAETPKEGKANAQRTRTLVLLMRYSGMRISDPQGSPKSPGVRPPIFMNQSVILSINVLMGSNFILRQELIPFCYLESVGLLDFFHSREVFGQHHLLRRKGRERMDEIRSPRF